MKHNEKLLHSLNELLEVNIALAKQSMADGNMSAAARSVREAADAAEAVYRLQRQEKRLNTAATDEHLDSAVELIKNLCRALDSQSGSGIECARWLKEHGW